DLGGNGGAFHICIPYSMFEPIRDLLYSSLQGEHMEVDNRWVRSLSKQIQGAEVELVANLGQAKVTFEQILSMQVGDVIPVDIPETVTAQVDNVPVMECRYGIINGQYALRVNSMISQHETE
ncbi:MAG: FliM/FliN family flagellar motor switch protein, partial [Nitrosomonas sp.]|nr:FliM/FliN family flagellar motor switch protein [Nitrosomonas sp.]